MDKCHFNLSNTQSAGSVLGLANPQSSDPVVTALTGGQGLGSGPYLEWGYCLLNGVEKVFIPVGTHWFNWARGSTNACINEVYLREVTSADSSKPRLLSVCPIAPPC